MALKPVMGPGPSAPVPALPRAISLDLTAGQAQQQFRELSRRALVSSGSQAEQRLDRSHPSLAVLTASLERARQND